MRMLNHPKPTAHAKSAFEEQTGIPLEAKKTPLLVCEGLGVYTKGGGTRLYFYQTGPGVLKLFQEKSFNRFWDIEYYKDQDVSNLFEIVKK